MTNSRIIEGTGKKIGSVLLGEPFASTKLRVYIDQDTEDDVASDIAPPPFTVRSEEHLKELLLASLKSPIHPVMSETWDVLHKRIDTLAARSGKRLKSLKLQPILDS